MIKTNPGFSAFICAVVPGWNIHLTLRDLHVISLHPGDNLVTLHWPPIALWQIIVITVIILSYNWRFMYLFSPKGHTDNKIALLKVLSQESQLDFSCFWLFTFGFVLCIARTMAWSYWICLSLTVWVCSLTDLGKQIHRIQNLRIESFKTTAKRVPISRISDKLQWHF